MILKDAFLCDLNYLYIIFQLLVCWMTSKISVKEAIVQLKQMFSDYDEEIISNALAQSSNS